MSSRPNLPLFTPSAARVLICGRFNIGCLYVHIVTKNENCRELAATIRVALASPTTHFTAMREVLLHVWNHSFLHCKTVSCSKTEIGKRM